MADVMLPSWLKIARLSTQYLDNTGMTRGLYTRAPETTGFGGDGLRLSLEFVPTSSRQTPVERAAIRSFLASLRGRQNRAYLWDPSYRGPRGAFKSFIGELLSNNTFANGTTGWSGAGTTPSLSVYDRVLRVTAGVGGSAYGAKTASYTTSVTQNAPHVFRVYFAGSAPASQNCRAYVEDSNIVFVETQLVAGASSGLASTVFVPTTGSIFVEPYATGTIVAGATIDVGYTSVSRCALVDNGPNGFTFSDQLNNAAWTKTDCSIIADATAAHDGTATADQIVEGSANTQHFVSMSVNVLPSAADVCISFFVKASGRNFIKLEMDESTGGTIVNQFFNIGTGAGAVGVNGATGANWSNRRAFVVDYGNGWYQCTLVARKTSAGTACIGYLMLATADGTSSYLGNGASAIYAIRGSLTHSSVPHRASLTTSSSASSGTSQTGSGLHLKGLPASTSGLLLPDDRFEIITSRGSEMKIVTASLDSDAAGLGYLQFSPPLKGIPADNAPIIIHNPMTRAIFAGDMVGWDDSPGVLTTASCEFEEA